MGFSSWSSRQLNILVILSCGYPTAKGLQSILYTKNMVEETTCMLHRVWHQDTGSPFLTHKQKSQQQQQGHRAPTSSCLEIRACAAKPDSAVLELQWLQMSSVSIILLVASSACLLLCVWCVHLYVSQQYWLTENSSVYIQVWSSSPVETV